MKKRIAVLLALCLVLLSLSACADGKKTASNDLSSDNVAEEIASDPSEGEVEEEEDLSSVPAGTSAAGSKKPGKVTGSSKASSKAGSKASSKAPSAVSQVPTGTQVKISYFAAQSIDFSALRASYSLTAAQQKVYDELLEGILESQEAISLSNSPSGDDVTAAWQVLRNTQPALYHWNSNAMNMTAKGDTTTFYATYTSESKAAMDQKVASALNEIKLYSGMTAYEMELAVNDWLAERVTYHQAAAAAAGSKDNPYPNAFTMYGAIVEKKAVCEGYSRAAQYILGLLGIKSLLITGKADGGPHMWNMVEIDGKWYQLDVTWNDPIYKEGTVDPPPYVHTYFNLTDAMMRKDHSYAAGGSGDDLNPKAINCTAKDAFYFTKAGRLIGSASEFQRIVAASPKTKLNSSSYCEFAFATGYSPTLGTLIDSYNSGKPAVAIKGSSTPKAGSQAFYLKF